jgi:hypothetical protein
MKHLSCYEPSGETEEKVYIIDICRYSRCGNGHKRIIQGDAKDSLGVDALSWLAKGVGEGAGHIYTLLYK